MAGSGPVLRWLVRPGVLAWVLAGPLCPGATVSAQPFAELCQHARHGALVRILHFGDSHLASQAESQSFRQFFQSQYGDGGPGLGLPWVAAQPGVTARAGREWHRSVKGAGDGRMGLSAGFLETREAGAGAELQAAFARFRIQLATDPAGGRAQISVDRVPLGEIDLAGPAGQLASFGKELPGGPAPHRLEIRTLRPGLVRILSVALEGRSGVAYSPLAFNGARAAWTQAVPEGLFQAQVRAEAPDLIILAFGTNEANARPFDPDGYRRDLEALLLRLRKAAPRALLLLAGPPDGRLQMGTASSLAGVIAAQRAAASSRGCLFVDQQQAMGGPGAIDAWSLRGWANRDHVHMTAPGYQTLARAVLHGLFAGTDQARGVDQWVLAEGRFGALASVPAGRPREEPAPHRIYTFRRPDGGVFITDNPDKVADQAGSWTLLPP